MNKKELIEKFREFGIYGLNIFGTVVEGIPTKTAIELIKQLDEPQKVVVPQFVADWYEEHKDNLEFYIFDYVYRFDQQKNSDFKDWLDGFKTGALQTLVNMHQFGYEVEKEKQYIIKLKGVPDGAKFLKYAKVTQEWYFGMKGFYSDREIIHTRKELEEANFGWVFNCEGIEVEEVKE